MALVNTGRTIIGVVVRRRFPASCGLLLFFAGWGCRTPEPKLISAELPQKPVRTHYVLRTLPIQTFHGPLPRLQEINKEWHYSDGVVEVVPALRTWDFNGDGRPDHIEILSEDGSVDGSASDYNFDGKPDVFRPKNGETSFPGLQTEVSLGRLGLKTPESEMVPQAETGR